MTKIIFLFIIFMSLMTEFSNAGLPPTSTQGNGESSYSTTFKFNFPNISVSRSGTTTTFNTVNVAGGGTGATTLTANNVILGNGTSAVQFVAPGATGNVLRSNGTTWVSDGVSGTNFVTSTGATSPEIQSAYFGTGANCASQCTTGTCAICRQVGNKITSITFVSTGNYDVNGIDGTKYHCWGSGVGGGYQPIYTDIAASTSTKARVISGNGGSLANIAQASVTCIGVP